MFSRPTKSKCDRYSRWLGQVGYSLNHHSHTITHRARRALHHHHHHHPNLLSHVLVISVSHSSESLSDNALLVENAAELPLLAEASHLSPLACAHTTARAPTAGDQPGHPFAAFFLQESRSRSVDLCAVTGPVGTRSERCVRR
jgi:hypothetical protein